MDQTFNQGQYSERVEQAFDQAFTYERPLTETFKYAHTMQHGTPEECAALRVQAIQEQQRQAMQQAAPEHQAAVQQLAPEQRPPLAVAGPAQAQQLEQPQPQPEQVRVPERKPSRGLGM